VPAATALASIYSQRSLHMGEHDALRNWALRAADAGNIDLMTSLGHAYARGLGVERDWVAAARWYRRAGMSAETSVMEELERTRVRAEAGDSRAMFELAGRFRTGRDVPRSQEEAYRLYRAAGNALHPRAQATVGVMLAIGEGVPAADRVAGARELEEAGRLAVRERDWHLLLSLAT
jgi:uncharacterized protein